MIHWIGLVITAASLQAQPLSRFERYCTQLKTPAADNAPRANDKVDPLRAVTDKVNKLDQLMNDNVVIGRDYAGFKAEMAKRKINLNDDYHAPLYAQAAKFKCDVLAEANEGRAGTQAFTAPTTEQLGRKVDDSGIGVGGPTGTGTSGPAGTEQ